MKYVSTRGLQEPVSASVALIQGIAGDGGLYVPQQIAFQFELSQLKNRSYSSLAAVVLEKYFAGSGINVAQCAKKAYDSDHFYADEPAVLKQIGSVALLELFHGRTAAFKDMALSILPYLMLEALRVEQMDKRVVILTATSGDTGKSALASFADVPGVDIIVFYPSEGVSDVQKRHMQSQAGSNVYVAGIRGNFDDAQSAVKQIFASARVRRVLEEQNKMLSSANSINIGRLYPQTVYYWYAYFALVKSGVVRLGDAVNFCVPTGNFGNILAGYYASLAGLPVKRLICASNENDVLTDFFANGTYDKNRTFKKTIAPSMDILISSNLERLLYHLSDGDGPYIKTLMEQLNEKGCYTVSAAIKEKMDVRFSAYYADEAEMKCAIKQTYEQQNYVLDPHTAAGMAVYEKYVKQTEDNTPCVVLSTASPYKFAGSVLSALDGRQADSFEAIRLLSEKVAQPLHPALANIEKAPVLHPDVCDKTEIEDFVLRVLKES